MRETGLLLAEREIWETLAAPSQILLSGAAAGSADLLHQNAKTAAGSAGVRQYRHSPHAKAKRQRLPCVERARLRMLLCGVLLVRPKAWPCFRASRRVARPGKANKQQKTPRKSSTQRDRRAEGEALDARARNRVDF